MAVISSQSPCRPPVSPATALIRPVVLPWPVGSAAFSSPSPASAWPVLHPTYRLGGTCSTSSLFRSQSHCRYRIISVRPISSSPSSAERSCPATTVADGTCIRLRRVGLAGQQLGRWGLHPLQPPMFYAWYTIFPPAKRPPALPTISGPLQLFCDILCFPVYILSSCTPAFPIYHRYLYHILYWYQSCSKR